MRAAREMGRVGESCQHEAGRRVFPAKCYCSLYCRHGQIKKTCSGGNMTGCLKRERKGEGKALAPIRCAAAQMVKWKNTFTTTVRTTTTQTSPNNRATTQEKKKKIAAATKTKASQHQHEEATAASATAYHQGKNNQTQDPFSHRLDPPPPTPNQHKKKTNSTPTDPTLSFASPGTAICPPPLPPLASRSHRKVSGEVNSSAAPPAQAADTLNHLSTNPPSPFSSSNTSLAIASAGSSWASAATPEPSTSERRPALFLPSRVVSCEGEGGGVCG